MYNRMIEKVQNQPKVDSFILFNILFTLFILFNILLLNSNTNDNFKPFALELMH